MEERASKQVALAILALVLLAVNFAFDWLRRLDFDSAEAKLNETLNAARAEVDTDTAAVAALYTEAESLIAVLDKSARELAAIAADLLRRTTLASAETIQSHNQDAGQERASRPEMEPLEDLLALESEFLLDGMRRRLEDPYLRSHYSLVRDHRKWRAEDLVPKLEAHFGVQLSDEDRAGVVHLLEFHRQLCAITLSSFDAALHLATAERVASRDYESSDPNEREAAPSDSFATSTSGERVFFWSAAKYPDLHRKWLLFQYAPCNMLLDVQNIFLERSRK